MKGRKGPSKHNMKAINITKRQGSMIPLMLMGSLKFDNQVPFRIFGYYLTDLPNFIPILVGQKIGADLRVFAAHSACVAHQLVDGIGHLQRVRISYIV